MTLLSPLFTAPRIARPAQYGKRGHGLACLVVLWLGASQATFAAAPQPVEAASPGSPPKPAAAASVPTRVAAPATAKEMGAAVREAVKSGDVANKRLTLVTGIEKMSAATRSMAYKSEATPETVRPFVPAVPGRLENPATRRQYLRAKAAAMQGHETQAGTNSHVGSEWHWSYEGDTGPQAWSKLKPEFDLCAVGKRQSPINIDDSSTLQGPAEALQFNYLPSTGSVVNNGHTIQVDLLGDNAITVRGSSFKLIQFHFHRPSEERVNFRSFAMVAHLVHQNAEGQLAKVAVLLEPGAANPLINKVWTYMPLDKGDRVRMPVDLLDMNELLPKDQRYYQFMGSLTTPPCTEGVLWMVLKTPVTVSREQLKLFAQLFPNNARPVQPINGRPVRDAQ